MVSLICIGVWLVSAADAAACNCKCVCAASSYIFCVNGYTLRKLVSGYEKKKCHDWRTQCDRMDKVHIMCIKIAMGSRNLCPVYLTI